MAVMSDTEDKLISRRAGQFGSDGGERGLTLSSSLKLEILQSHHKTTLQHSVYSSSPDKENKILEFKKFFFFDAVSVT